MQMEEPNKIKMLECPIENTPEIVWNNTYPGFTHFQSCPHGFKGQASRYCSIEGNKGKWQKPNMDNCIRAQFESIMQRIKQIHDGILVDELGKLLHEFANETKAVTEANTTVDTDLRASIDILATASNMLSGIERDPTSQEIEDFFSATDNIMDINTKNAWKELHEHTGENKAATILSIVSNISDLVLKTLPKHGSFNLVKKNLALQIKRTNIEQITFPDDFLNFSSQVILPNSSILNSFNVTETVDYSAAYYKTIATFLHQYKFERLRKEVGSDVISFSVNNNKSGKKLCPPLKIFFKTVQTNFSVAECSYWDFTLPHGGNWATDGCEAVFRNEVAIECRCDHMTSFAVLLSMTEMSDDHHGVLTTMSIIGCTVSIVCLVLCMICYAIVWKKIKYDKARKRNSDKDVILVLLCLSLICAYLTFILGIDRTQSKVICTAVAVLLHFLLLTVLCLMAAEGIIHAVLVTAVFQRPSINKLLIPLSFVIPVVIVIISGVVTRLDGYGTDKVCWLSVDSGLIYVFFVPCVVVMSVNWVIAGVVLKTMFSVKANRNKTMTENLKIGIRSLFIMAPVFGLTWLFGLFSFGEHAIVFSYLFVIFNSLQGAVIFTVHIVMDEAVRNVLKKRVFRLRKQQDCTMQLTDKTNNSNILKRIKKDTKDTATFSFDEGTMDSNDVPPDEFHRTKL